MFKKLKDKIAEEVKSSPQKVQQLAQAVVHGAASLQVDEGMFSIAEDKDESFSNVSLNAVTSPPYRSRRNSNTSVASDVSFLPSFESHGNLYHLQSDLDVSASEIEDNYNSQLERVSKEQILQAFKKMQMKYNKYRGRYTDLANHYRILERENTKTKSVLVETQDKALRRVSELKEQCTLEQSAKAHIENILREDLNEKEYLIETLHTKIKLLQEPAITNELVSITGEPERAQLQQQQQQLDDLKRELAEKKEEMETLVEHERNNNLQLAQNKLAVHAELEQRDLEISKLKQEVEKLQMEKDNMESRHGKEMSSVRLQNNELCEELVKVRGEHAHTIQTVRNEMKKKMIDLEIKMDAARRSEEQKRLLEDRSEGKTELSAENERLSAEMCDLSRKLEQERNSKIALEEHLNELLIKMKEYEHQISRKANVVARLERTIIDNENQIRDAEGENEELAKSIDDQRTKAKENYEAVVQLTEMVAAKDNEIIKLQRHKQDMSNKIDELQSEGERYTVALTELERLIVGKENELTSVQQETKVEIEQNKSTIMEFIKLIGDRDKQITETLQVNQDMKREMEGMKTKIEEHSTVVKNLQQLASEKDIQLARARCEREKEASALSNEYQNLQLQKDELAAALSSVAANNAQLRQQLEETHEDLTVSRSRRAEATEENVKLTEKMDECERKLADDQLSRSMLQAQNKEMETKWAEVHAELTRLNAEKQLINDNARKELSDELRATKVCLNDAVKQNKVMTGQQAGLIAELETQMEQRRAHMEALENEQGIKDRRYLAEVEEFREKIERLETSAGDSKTLQKETEAMYDSLVAESEHVKESLRGARTELEQLMAEKEVETADRLRVALEGKRCPESSGGSDQDQVNGYKDEGRGAGKTRESHAGEVQDLLLKLSRYENMAVSNKESVQYLENELEKLQNKNEKLKSKLDETLVTLAHCADISSSTEMEYLRNILYNYMIGKESVVLARVIAAVCKFDTIQTEAVLQKEQQKQTLLGHLGIL